MEKFILSPIGVITHEGGDTRLVLDTRYAPALAGLEDFSHVHILWWFSGTDTPEDRAILTEPRPYRMAPNSLGTFATRSPRRPNPIALDCAQITYIDAENATVGLAFIDAQEGSPVLDIKPYTPSLDRVERPTVPAWSSHWPASLEESASFDWDAELNA